MPQSTASAVLDRIGGDGRSRTTARALVIAAALRRAHPFTAQDLVSELARRGVGRATVYRTLDLLVERDVLSRIHAIEQGARCVRYTACAPTHHHHLPCRGCGRVEEIRATGLESRIARLAREHGYEALEHGVEIAGLCAECRA
jgi:Fur family ferric uptake transcriptional regulator